MRKILFFILCFSFIFASCKNTSEGGNEPQIIKHKVSFGVQNSNTGSLTAQIKGGDKLIKSPSMVENGKIVIFTATPNKDYVVESWFNGTTNVTAQATEDGKKYELTVDKALEVKVKFKKATAPSPQTHNLIFEVDGDGGTLKAEYYDDGVSIPTSPATIEHGKAVMFTAESNNGYEIEKWTHNGNVVNGERQGYDVTIDKDTVIKVKFRNTAPPPVQTRKVTFGVVDNKGGTLKAKVEGETTEHINGTTGFDVEKGKKVIFTATPESNYEVEEWTSNGRPVPNKKDNEYKLSIGNNVTVLVKFKAKTPPVPETMKVKFSVEGSNGTLTAKIKGETENLTTSSDGASVEKGKIVVFTATANSGYKVEKWFKDGNEETGKTENTYELVITADVSVKVKFTAITQVNGSYDSTTGVGKIGAATFTMKRIDEVSEVQLGNPREKHKVSLSPYWIGETEVIQKLWQEVMKENPSFFDNTGSKIYNGISYETAPQNDEIQENRPVEQITWFDAIVFCNELTKQIGLGDTECVYYSDEAWTKVYTKEDAKNKRDVFIYKTTKDAKNMSNEMNKKGFRLPTEAEWEWAAMGGKGETWAGTNEEGKVLDYAWLDANSIKRTHEVKKKNPNAYGLYDMTGNVMECCWDWYGTIAKDSDSGKNPIGPITGTERTVRGGSFVITMEFLVGNKMRGKLASNLPQRYLGMRLVKGN